MFSAGVKVLRRAARATSFGCMITVSPYGYIRGVTPRCLIPGAPGLGDPKERQSFPETLADVRRGRSSVSRHGVPARRDFGSRVRFGYAGVAPPDAEDCTVVAPSRASTTGRVAGAERWVAVSAGMIPRTDANWPLSTERQERSPGLDWLSSTGPGLRFSRAKPYSESMFQSEFAPKSRLHAALSPSHPSPPLDLPRAAGWERELGQAHGSRVGAGIHPAAPRPPKRGAHARLSPSFSAAAPSDSPKIDPSRFLRSLLLPLTQRVGGVVQRRLSACSSPRAYSLAPLAGRGLG